MAKAHTWLSSHSVPTKSARFLGRLREAAQRLVEFERRGQSSGGAPPPPARPFVPEGPTPCPSDNGPKGDEREMLSVSVTERPPRRAILRSSVRKCPRPPNSHFIRTGSDVLLAIRFERGEEMEGVSRGLERGDRELAGAFGGGTPSTGVGTHPEERRREHGVRGRASGYRGIDDAARPETASRGSSERHARIIGRGLNEQIDPWPRHAGIERSALSTGPTMATRRFTQDEGEDDEYGRQIRLRRRWPLHAVPQRIESGPQVPFPPAAPVGLGPVSEGGSLMGWTPSFDLRAARNLRLALRQPSTRSRQTRKSFHLRRGPIHAHSHVSPKCPTRLESQRFGERSVGRSANSGVRRSLRACRAHRFGREEEGFFDVVLFQIRKELENLLLGHAVRDHIDDHRHGDAESADTRNTTQLVLTDGDAGKRHGSRVASRSSGPRLSWHRAGPGATYEHAVPKACFCSPTQPDWPGRTMLPMPALLTCPVWRSRSHMPRGRELPPRFFGGPIEVERAELRVKAELSPASGRRATSISASLLFGVHSL